MLLTNDENEYVVIDEETVKTYLFNCLASGKINYAGLRYLIINIKGTQYWFNNDLNLVEVTPLSENAYALTIKGFIKWNNPSRKNTRFKNEEILSLGSHVTLLSLSKLVCSNYICIEHLPKNRVKITRKNLTAVDFFTSYKDNLRVEIEENNEKLVITHKGDAAVTIEVQADNTIIPIFSITPNNKIILTKGTCFKIKERYVHSKNTGRKFNYSNKELYLCY